MADKKTFKVLVVEDEKFLIKIYDMKLKNEGFDVSLAEDGEEAVKAAVSEKMDIILLDLVLPKMNCLEVLENIRKSPMNKDTPVIILSNIANTEFVDKAKALGVIDYFTKANTALSEIVTKIREKLKT
jgi:CheY-like chemotaxis protein